MLRGRPEIVDGHDGLLYSRHEGKLVPKPYLLDWLLCVYVGNGDAARSEKCQLEEAGR